MTMPTLIHKQNERETVVRLKKIHSVLSQAFLRACEENGTPDTWDLNAPYTRESAERIADVFVKYMKVIKNCGTEAGCMEDVNYKRLNGSQDSNYNQDPGFSKMILADGASIFFTVRSENCTEDRGPGMLKDVCGVAYIDVNGPKRPNQWGKDVFAFAISKTGVIPNGTQEETLFPFSTCKQSSTGYGCTAWVIFNENMDYLKCSDLSWSGKRTCKY